MYLSMGFYGDYSKYAKQLTDSAEDAELADTNESQEDGGNPQSAQAEDQNTTENNNADKTKDNESYSKTVDGTTVTLSEVYCNEIHSLHLMENPILSSARILQ